MTTTMEKTNLDEFERLLEESFSKSFSVADIVEGTVMKKESDGYLISVKGAKTEAFLPLKEISSSDSSDSLEIGDEKEFYVLKEINICHMMFYDFVLLLTYLLQIYKVTDTYKSWMYEVKRAIKA